ncbi:DUF3658 domain-containing protein [Vibrio harveyi]|uniref:DUF3658 domain-containing protein n=1 Tax=Vibrio harveyi TaxID=669 RepID=UPI002480EAD1|nr:DUF3658 domain-containing protein [Vibrio harveyi]
MTTRKITHFVVGGASAGILNYLLAPDEKKRVVELCDPLAYGPLMNYGTVQGGALRSNWFRRVCSLINESDLWPWLSDHIGLPILQSYQDLERDGDYVVWVGQSVDEQLMLRLLCSVLPEHSLFLADVTTGQLDKGTIPIVGACSTKEHTSVIPVPIDIFQQAKLAKEWDSILVCRNMVRTWNGSAIISHDETFFDEALLSAIGSRVCVAAEAIGRVLGDYVGQVGDTFLCYRLRVLILKGIVCTVGEGPLFRSQLSLAL